MNTKADNIVFVIEYTHVGSAITLVKEGFAVYGIDYQGHGKSAGLDAYIENFDDIVNDCCDHFTSICGEFTPFYPIHIIPLINLMIN